ncbi:MAG: ISNCY family transposase [bacterium]
MKDIFKMSQKEINRLHIIRKAIDKRIGQREASEILELSERQIRRLVRRIKEESDKGIIHRSRGGDPHHAIAEGIRRKVLDLCRGRYSGFNPTFASEKLFEREKIKISHETLRQWFIAENIEYERRESRPHRMWRERRAHCGEMVQMDGSHHAWFEGRREPCVLMGYIDDADSHIYARFYEYEGTIPAMDSFKRYILKHGVPHAVYLDCHTTYKGGHKRTIEDELLNRESLSHFGKALRELDVRLIHARSPQAKGRVERLFKTLQDRLVKEMRLMGIDSIAEANKFLSKYLLAFNKRFSVEALMPEDLHRSLSKSVDLDKIFSVKTVRVLRNDFTVIHGGRLYQVEERTRAKEVTVEERINGSLFIMYKGRALRYRKIEKRPERIKEAIKQSGKMHTFYILPKDHPWRNFRLPGSPPVFRERVVFSNN